MKKLAMSTTALVSLAMMVSTAAAATGSVPSVNHTNTQVKVAATSTYQNGVTPQQMRKAYAVDQISNNGAGQTIAIVDAYTYPTAANDLQVFDNQFGLPAANLTIHSFGSRSDGGWDLEQALDIEWAHTIAPSANILLVQAATNGNSDLMNAEDYAANSGAVVASNSWGGTESSGDTSYNSHFQHSGVVFVASAGDSGGAKEWPAVDPDVLSVGGTTLNYASDGTYQSESGWSSSGGGTSAVYARPSYQNNVQNVVGSSRGVPDIGMDADPNSGAAVYDSTSYQGQTGWFQVGGTSLSAPMWAGLVALADQNRTSKLTGQTAIGDLYNMSASNFHDVTSGSNGNPCQVGYDLVTGIGTPIASSVVPAWTSAP